MTEEIPASEYTDEEYHTLFLVNMGRHLDELHSKRMLFLPKKFWLERERKDSPKLTEREFRIFKLGFYAGRYSSRARGQGDKDLQFWENELTK